MNYISEIIIREKERLTELKSSYENQLERLPKGSVQKKVQNGKVYYYLAFRDSNRVITKYIGGDSEAKKIKEQVEKRKHAVAMIKKIKEELKRIEKALEGAK